MSIGGNPERARLMRRSASRSSLHSRARVAALRWSTDRVGSRSSWSAVRLAAVFSRSKAVRMSWVAWSWWPFWRARRARSTSSMASWWRVSGVVILLGRGDIGWGDRLMDRLILGNVWLGASELNPQRTPRTRSLHSNLQRRLAAQNGWLSRSHQTWTDRANGIAIPIALATSYNQTERPFSWELDLQ
jgi:hypothetical protein